jgi:hypothetical protein
LHLAVALFAGRLEKSPTVCLLSQNLRQPQRIHRTWYNNRLLLSNQTMNDQQSQFATISIATNSAHIENLKVQTPPVTSSDPFILQQQVKPKTETKTTLMKQRTEKHVATLLCPYDVICGRSSTAFQNVGNKRFRVTMALNLQRYMAAKSRKDKTIVISSLLRTMQEDVGARFLKLTKNGYVELDNKASKEKVGHALRDLALAYIREQHQKLGREQQEAQEDEALSNSISDMMAAVYESSSSSDASSSYSSSSSSLSDDDDLLSLDPLPFAF